MGRRAREPSRRRPPSRGSPRRAGHARALAERAAFPWITSNLVDRAGRPFASLPTRRLLRVGGLLVGFVGLTDDFGTTTQEGNVGQTDLVEAAAREAKELRREGAEAVVALTQPGFDVNRRILLEVPAVDAVLTEEESETVSVVRWVGGRPAAAPCGNIGSVVELVLEKRYGRISARVAVHAVDGSIVPDPSLAAEERKWMELLDERLATPAGTLAAPLDNAGSPVRETALGNLVADAFRESAGADAALVLGSSLRAPLPAGPLTRRHAMAVLPFGNRVVIVELTGSALRAPLDDDARYRVAVSSQVAAGGNGHVEVAAGRRLAGDEDAPLDADALVAHLLRLSKAGPAPACLEGRIAFRHPD